ncbi:CDP-alcohol phosphatidyltransferase family protein [Candidatus Saccharibacteria bacterium]|nr:CDP-alcohol phosphatidyltransferase family protein [Candidatus Saccharibacteria bacterium]
MRYLADLLTLTRFILSIILIVLSFIGTPAENAFIIFLTAELTDTFDGTSARKWPFPKNKTPKYRKYAAQFDIVSDVLLAAGQVLFCALQVNWIAGLIVIIYYIVICGTLELILYGKLFGHPDNCTKNSLTKRNFPLAKKIVLARRYLYTICLGVINAFILFATSWPMPVKIGLFIFGCSIFVFIWFFLRQRRKNVSRDAVDIEQKLTSSAKKTQK